MHRKKFKHVPSRLHYRFHCSCFISFSSVHTSLFIMFHLISFSQHLIDHASFLLPSVHSPSHSFHLPQSISFIFTLFGCTHITWSFNLIVSSAFQPIPFLKFNNLPAICKSWNRESGNGMKGMMGTREIRVGMRGINVRTWEIRVGTWETKVGMQGIRVGMRGMGWECWECGESGWEHGESGWECRESGWECGESGWECGGIRVGMGGIRVRMRGIRVECGESGWKCEEWGGNAGSGTEKKQKKTKKKVYKIQFSFFPEIEKKAKLELS